MRILGPLSCGSSRSYLEARGKGADFRMFVAEKLFWRRNSDNAAAFQQNDPRSQKQRFAQIVRDKYDRFSEAARERAEFPLQFRARDRVERAERLVHQENGGIGGQRAGHSNTLALPSGKFARTSMRKFPRVESHKPQHFLYARSGAGGVPFFETGHQAHVLGYGEMGEKTGVLNHIPDSAAQLDRIPYRS
jgi:hypothetical protein